jgi:hypothetical protein
VAAYRARSRPFTHTDRVAVVSITVPDVLIPRLVAAGKAAFPQYANLPDTQLLRRIAADQWTQMLAVYEANQASSSAATKAVTDSGGIT